MFRTSSWRKIFALMFFLALAGCGSTTTSSPTSTPPLAGSPAANNTTATAISKNCFIDPSGPSVPSIYTSSATPSAGPVSAPAVSGTPVTLSGGLKYVDIKTGTGQAARSGSTLAARYTGWLASTCQKFDSSYDRPPGSPFTFTVGQGQVIQGWDQGLPGIKAGGIRRLFIPAALGYGSQAQGLIPANSDLIFDVQAISVQ
jgi:FKBP-type peptidyl-prolyl cis-trans isomerase